MFGNLRIITIFDNFLLLNQGDLSVHCSYHSSTSNVHRQRCNNTLIFLWRFKLSNLVQTPLFKVAFPKHTCDKSFTFLAVTYLDYHFVQSDLVDSGFLKA